MSITRLLKQVVFYWALAMLALMLITITLTIRYADKWQEVRSSEKVNSTKRIVNMILSFDWQEKKNLPKQLEKIAAHNNILALIVYYADGSKDVIKAPSHTVTASDNLNLPVHKDYRLYISYASDDKNRLVFITSVVSLSLIVFLCMLLAMHLWMRLIFSRWLVSEKIGENLTTSEWHEHQDDDLNYNDTKFSHLLVQLYRRYQQSEIERFNQADNIRKQSFVDPETGLGNRHFFDAQLNIITSEFERESHGAVFLIHFNFFSDHNYVVEDQEELAFLQDVAGNLNDFVSLNYHGCVARRTPSDFALVLEMLAPHKTTQVVEKLAKLVEKIKLPGHVNKLDFFNIGVAYFFPGMDSYTILSEADMALRTAQLQATNSWYMHDKQPQQDTVVFGSVKWRAILESVLEHRRVQLRFLPAFKLSNNEIMFYEVLTCIQYQNETIAGARFFPMAHSLGLTTQMDRLIIDTVFKTFIYPQDLPCKIALNIYGNSLMDQQFYAWLMGRLVEKPKLAKKIIFEIPELAMSKDETRLLACLCGLQELGCEIGIDSVGQPLASSHYLHELKVSYLKLDSLVVREIDLHSEKQLFVRSIMEICKELDLPLLAEGVEKDKELHFLEEMRIKGAQGYLLSKALSEITRLETVA